MKSKNDMKQNLLHESQKIQNLENYVSWINENLRDLQIKLAWHPKKKVAVISGIIFGGLSSVINVKFSYKFGESLTSNVPMLGAIYFSSATAITVGALMIDFTQDLFCKILLPSSQAYEKITIMRKCDKSAYYLNLVLIVGASVTASIYSWYLSDLEFSHDLRSASYFIILPTFVGNFAATFWSAKNQLSMLYYFSRVKIGKTLSLSRINQELLLVHFLESIIRYIKQLPKETAKVLYEQIINIANIDDLLTFLNENGGVKELSGKNSKSYCERFFEGLGVVVGGVSAYSLFPIGKATGEWLAGHLGIQDENTINNFSNTIGSISYLCSALLSMYTTKIGFEKVYNALIECKKKQKCSDQISLALFGKTVLALSTTSSRLELVLEYMKNGEVGVILVGICAVIGPVATFFWGLDKTINKVFPKEEDEQSKICILLNNMIEVIPKMSADSFSDLFSCFNDKNWKEDEVNDTLQESRTLMFSNSLKTSESGHSLISNGIKSSIKERLSA